MRELELLSPANNFEAAKAAVLYGANAVYIGGENFGLRANAGFSEEEVIKAANYAHLKGVKIYLACNIVADNNDADAFPEFIKKMAKTNIDACIVSDLGIFDLVKICAPELPIHVSTQAGVNNYACANLWHKLGAKRVILAREVSLENVKRIRDKTPPELEIEVFVHGAMCMAFSGRCLLSAYLTSRDANKGECAHPCRWNYSLMEETRPNEFFPVFEEARGSYILNSKDLCMLEHIKELESAGVSSLKIEGRAKTAYYTAVITSAYRAGLDALKKGEALPDWAKREVFCASRRPYSTGFYFKDIRGDINNSGSSYDFSGYIRDCDFIGTVDGYNNGLLEITQRNYFTVNDDIEVISPFSPPEVMKITKMFNSAGEEVEIANHALEKLSIPYGKGFKEGSMMRRINVN